MNCKQDKSWHQTEDWRRL